MLDTEREPSRITFAVYVIRDGKREDIARGLDHSAASEFAYRHQKNSHPRESAFIRAVHE